MGFKCGRCNGVGETYRLYDKKDEEIKEFKSGKKYMEAVKSDRYRLPEPGDGEFHYPWPQCPRCKGHGMVETRGGRNL